MHRTVLILAGVAAALAVGFWSDWGAPAVKQPIEFPHKRHIEQNIPCTGCHQRAEKDLVAGVPATALCLACHISSDSTNPEIEKLKVFGEKGEEIPWRRVWRLPAHVFFSHRVHVAVAKLDCQPCHGPMETLDRPPPRPLKTLDMDGCIACHTKSRSTAEREAKVKPAAHVSSRRLINDCNVCHR